MGSKIGVKMLLICLLVFSQQMSQARKIDSTYITDHDYKFGVSIGATFYYQAIDQLSVRYPENNATFTPQNLLPGIDMGIYWKKSSLRTSYITDFLLDNNKNLSKSFNFQYQYFGRKVVFDLFYYRYKGFVKHYNDNTDGAKEPRPSEEFPEMSMTSYGLFAQYVPNGRRFSHSAAFNLSARQQRSCGSFLVGGGIYNTRVRNGGDSLLYHLKPQNLQLGFNFGYVYTWAFAQNFYLTGSLSVGANFGLTPGESKTFDVNPQIYPRMAIGYRNGPWATVISSQNNKIFIFRNKDFNLSTDINKFQFSLIRFLDKYPPVLDKIPKWISN